ncbi:hypothetical protein ZWY2020_003000 [Hordeum vulgare]|nr:hypothetical protein ZWY2020_003000 [Hordeum vulgare]
MEDQLDSRSNNKLVANMEGDASATQAGSQRRRTGKNDWQPKLTFEEMLDAPCKMHTGAKLATHTLRECSFAQRLSRGEGLPAPPGVAAAPRAPAPGATPARPPPPPNDGRLHDNYPHQDRAYVVVTNEGDDKHSQRQRRCEVNATVPPVPQYMHWSEKAITWSRVDHPAVMPNPGSYTLVLDPTFTSQRLTCRFTRVLVDGGNNINILYLDTLLNLEFKEKDLQPTSTIFHDIVPGQSCSPIGKIQLDVRFGDKAHFGREPIWFDVVDLNNPYHALLGRTALAKFMAIPPLRLPQDEDAGSKGYHHHRWRLQEVTRVRTRHQQSGRRHGDC